MAVLVIGQNVHIDRSKKFPVQKFVGSTWSIIEEDERSLALSEIDLENVVLSRTLPLGKNSIRGYEKHEFLRATGCIRLDANVFWTLWNDQKAIPESWKEEMNGHPTFIYFDGTVLTDSTGERFVLYLCYYGSQWCWGKRWLGHYWNIYKPSALLPRDYKKVA